MPITERARAVLAAALTVWLVMDAAVAAAPASALGRGFVPLSSGSALQDKDFYLLSVLEADAGLRRAVQSDPALSAIAKGRRARLEQAHATCKGEVACLVTAFLWSDAEVADAGDALVAALQRSGDLDRLSDARLRPSGRFIRYADLSAADLVRQAWRDAAAGLNHVLHVYGLGEAPLYPLIDSASYPVGDKMWRDGVNDMVDVALAAPDETPLFFQPTLRAALDVLDMNDRDEPARLEPLDKGENAAALAYARTLDWKAWRYPAMLIPGRSPTLKDNPLSPEAKMKMRLAARRFRAGEAPLIVVSGGYVSPSQTRFCEALEMKRALMHAYGVPERAILVDPYARHTTTNLRNTERLLVEAGAPLDRPVLVTTTAYQSAYIEGQVFRDRCVRELGYACYADLTRLSVFDTTLRLPLASLQRSAADPLDP